MQACTLVLQGINRDTAQGAAEKSLLLVSHVVTVERSRSFGWRFCSTATMIQREEVTNHLSSVSFSWGFCVWCCIYGELDPVFVRNMMPSSSRLNPLCSHPWHSSILSQKNGILNISCTCWLLFECISANYKGLQLVGLVGGLFGFRFCPRVHVSSIYCHSFHFLS